MFLVKRLIPAFVFVILSLSLHAQYVNYGTDPARIKWNIVRTGHYNVIYPRGNDSLAYKYVQLLETTYPYVQQSIGKSDLWKFPVVLHPSNMLSNGMVAWAPRRMELLTTPSADNSAQAWDSHLVLHESRHVFQTRKLTHGLFKPLYYLFGEQSFAISNVALPTWFLEGDAVATETALSSTGRGRLPEFNMLYRTHAMTDDFYSFDKWFLGSYKDYTGSKYALGYDMTAYARHEYGNDIWDKVTTRYIKRFLNIPPFTKALKHHTGIGKDELFHKTFSFLRKDWERQDNAYFQSNFRPQYLLDEFTDYTAYKYPVAINESQVIALKSSLKDINSLVMLSPGKKERLTWVGSINSKLILNNRRIYWTEYVSGLRWSHENHSVLKYYDLATRKTVTVTPGKRYQAPAIDPKGNIAAVSEFAENGDNRIILIDIEKGKEMQSFSSPGNAFAKDMTFSDNGQVYAVLVGDNGITIQWVDIASGIWSKTLDETWANINDISWNNGKLYFESGLDGTNNIYELDTASGQAYKITTARFGAFTPTLSNHDKLYFADFQNGGYRPATAELSTLTRDKANFKETYRFALAESISEKEAFNADTVQLKEVEFKPKRYSKLLHVPRIHSWSPVYFDVSDIISMDVDDFSTIVKPGVMVLSQNVLNTAIGQAGYYYRNGSHYGKLDFTYTGFYPVIDLEMTYGGDAFDAGWVTDEEKKRESLMSRYTDRTLFEAEAKVYIPFNLTRNHYIRGIQPMLTYYFTNNRLQQHASKDYNYFQYLMPELRFYSYRRMATRDILPRLGYQFRLQGVTPLNGGDLYGQLYAARLTTYLPGLFANNSLMIRLGYQYQHMDKKLMFVPVKIIDAPRGYSYSTATHQLFDLKADYAFAFAHPDWSLGSVAYVKRLRSNLFFDLAANQRVEKDKWTTRSSAGVDLLLDWNVLQIEFPLTTGVRMIKPFEKNGISAEFLFSIAF